MNFVNMPELGFKYGYFIILILMGLVALLQSFWLWRRGWFQDWTMFGR
jgi:magnesium transporter